MADEETNPDLNGAVTIPVHMTEARQFRTIHANGAMGGVTGLADVYLAFFSERATHPPEVEMTVLPDGRTNVDSRVFSYDRGITRELEVGVFMTPAAAWELARFILDTLRSSGLLVETPNERSTKESDAPNP